MSMKNLSQWFCRGCRSIKPRSAFPKHIDAGTLCLDCQRGLQRQQAAEPVLPQQVEYARKRIVKTPGNHDRNHDKA